MKLRSMILLVLTMLAYSSCAPVPGTANSRQQDYKYMAFKQRSDYQKTYNVYKNPDVLRLASAENTLLKIDISDQRAQLIINGRVALDTPCCTGKRSKPTPLGNFRITEKIVTKRSTIFGSIYKNGRKVYGGDRRKYRGSYDRYVGAPLPYWMRLTGDGIGIHQSRGVHRHPASNGCIRVPEKAVKMIFSNTQVGTPVQIVP